MFISVITSMYNEEESIREYIEQTMEVLSAHYQSFELIIVDDGSQDGSVDIAKEVCKHYSNIRLILLSRNFGHDNALTAGMQIAKGDLVLLMDSDLQNPPHLIPQLIEKLKEGYDVVYAARKERHGESFLKKSTSRFFYWIAKKLTGLNILSDAADFRVMNRNVVTAINRMAETNRKLTMIYAYVGFKIGSVPYEVPPRFAGKSKYNYRKLLHASLDSILGFSGRPLRFMSIISICASILSAGYAGFIFLERLLFNNLVDGVASILCVSGIMFSLLFLFLALLSEYISRIMLETKKRPLYFIREEIDFHE